MEKTSKNNNTVSEESQEIPSSLKDKFNKSEEFELFSNQKAEIPDFQDNAKLTEFPIFQSIYQPMNFISKLNYSSFTGKQNFNQRKMNLVQEQDYSIQDCFKSKSFQRFHTKQNKENFLIENYQKTFQKYNKDFQASKNKQKKKQEKQGQNNNIQSLIFKKSQDIQTKQILNKNLKKKYYKEICVLNKNTKPNTQNYPSLNLQSYTNNFKGNNLKQANSKVSINKQIRQSNLNSLNYINNLNRKISIAKPLTNSYQITINNIILDPQQFKSNQKHCKQQTSKSKTTKKKLNQKNKQIISILKYLQ